MEIKKYVILTALILFSFLARATTESYYLQMTDSATYYIEQSDWINAERTLKEALRSEPGNVGNALLLNNLARVQQQTGRYHEALENFNIALAITPSNSLIRYNRGMLLFAFGKNEEAAEDFSYAVRADDKDSNALMMRGMSYMRAGRTEDAERDLRNALALDSNNVDCMEALARILITGDDEKVMEGISLLRKITEKEPSAENHFRLGFAQAVKGDISGAEETVRVGLSVDPQYGNLYLLRAYLHQSRYETEAKELDIKIGTERGGDMNIFRSLLK